MSKSKKKTAKQASERAEVLPAAGEDKLAAAIGRRLVEAREGLGFSQQNVAFRSKENDPAGEGISRSTLSLYETGVNKPGARELMVLCETLKITPNWLLYGADSPAKTLQASMEFIRGNDLQLVARLALAVAALEPVERDSFASLILASVNKTLGDVKLAGLLDAADYMREPLLKELLAVAGVEDQDIPLRDLLQRFVEKTAADHYTNTGTLRPAVHDDSFDPFVDGPPPARKLRQHK